MIADLYAYELGDVMLLTMSGAVKDSVMAKLDQFIFSEDVQLGDVTDTFAQIAVVGPDAAVKVASIVSGVAEDGAARDARTRQRARASGRAARRSSRASPTPASRDSTSSSSALQAGALKTALMAAGVDELDDADGRSRTGRVRACRCSVATWTRTRSRSRRASSRARSASRKAATSGRK